jgi:hypothetical protein
MRIRKVLELKVIHSKQGNWNWSLHLPDSTVGNLVPETHCLLVVRKQTPELAEEVAYTWLGSGMKMATLKQPCR